MSHGTNCCRLSVGFHKKRGISGDHVGPGSRVTVANGGQITLYAEWAKSLDRDDLLYIVRGDEIVLTGYRGKGDVQPFVIPAEIDGKPVVEIGGSLLQVIASIGK